MLILEFQVHIGKYPFSSTSKALNTLFVEFKHSHKTRINPVFDF